MWELCASTRLRRITVVCGGCGCVSPIQCVAVVRPMGVLEMNHRCMKHCKHCRHCQAVFPTLRLFSVMCVFPSFMYLILVERPEALSQHVLHNCSLRTTVLYRHTAPNSKRLHRTNLCFQHTVAAFLGSPEMIVGRLTCIGNNRSPILQYPLVGPSRILV